MEGPEKKKRGFPFRKKEPPPETPEQIAAREAAERRAAEEAARLEAIGEAWAGVSERVRDVLPTSADPRQAYFLSLARQGREAEEQGRDSVAAHCRACIDKGLEAVIAARAAEAVAATPRAPREASPLERLKARWDEGARERAARLLQRHAARLAPSEREAYAASVEGLAAAPTKGSAAASQNARLLRRKLVDRLTRAELYRRRAARLRDWTLSAAPAASATGPYNDYAALEDAVRRVAASHPEWAAEFLDLYGNMDALRKAYAELLPKGKGRES